MSELDYQMALLLQHRFEQEFKSAKNAQKSDFELARQLQEEFEAPKTDTRDLELARQLQEQFEHEQAIEKPSGGLVYKQTGHNSSKCLTDPTWEVIDPTPDIHSLFMVFNERFFWNKLLAVCVSWSKKMTTCAGVCSYNGRGGMCSITLSEPLLKLRPRKDLVETLLHEMIHAFLFVTHNNKDRDGHGPEFHKHMYRINKESGTNITVYHDFHDEVRLYQQHWWRCDGPCQNWKPYFGMVRRAMNRAPGPNDRWWEEHSRRCGGTFTKVKEPEKENKSKKNEVKSKDIRTFLPVVKSTDSSNVKGFKDLSNKVKGKYNSTSTIVVTKNTKTVSENSFKPTVFNSASTSKAETSSFKPTVFNSPSTSKAETNSLKPTNSKAETSSSGGNCTEDFLSVRSHWANKFNNTKRPRSEEPSTSRKIQKVFETLPSEDYCECPVCNKKIRTLDLNSHLDSCLEKPEITKPEIVDLSEEKEQECPLCNRKFESSDFDIHLQKCIKKIYDGIEEQWAGKESQETVSCLACGKKILKTDLNSHLDDCMVNIFDDGDEKEEGNSSSQSNCPFCIKLIEETEMKEHIDGCLKADHVGVLEAFLDTSF